MWLFRVVDFRAPGNYRTMEALYPAFLSRYGAPNALYFHVYNVMRAPREFIKYLIELLRYSATIPTT